MGGSGIEPVTTYWSVSGCASPRGSSATFMPSLKAEPSYESSGETGIGVIIGVGVGTGVCAGAGTDDGVWVGNTGVDVGSGTGVVEIIGFDSTLWAGLELELSSGLERLGKMR